MGSVERLKKDVATSGGDRATLIDSLASWLT
jgi:hypothetical protein